MQEFISKAIDIFPFRLVIILGLAAGIVVAPLILLGLTSYTRSTESYCMGCHEHMAFAEEFFKPSQAHGESITCTDCHIEDTQSLISGRYYADDKHVTERCLGCHLPVLEGNVNEMGVVIEDTGVSRKNRGSVIKYKLQALHQAHINENTQCVDCHRNIQHDLYIPRTNLPRVEYCIQCHPNHDYATKMRSPKMDFVKE